MPKKKTPKELAELFNVKVSGSFEDAQETLYAALKQSDYFGSVEDDWDKRIEATFPDNVVISIIPERGKGKQFWKATWKQDKKGVITFTNKKQVMPKTVLKAVNESAAMLAELRVMDDIEDLSEILSDEPVIFNFTEAGEEEGAEKVWIGDVETAQVADTKNRNNRVYPRDLLHESYKDLKTRLDKHGSIPMDHIHRKDASGKNERNLRETVMLINEVSWDETTGRISLGDIRFTRTAAGEDIQSLVEDGLKLQVSQRAVGKSAVVKDDSLGIVEKVQQLKIDGFDCLRAGDASVVEADLNFKYKAVSEEVLAMADKELVGKDDVATMIEANNDTLTSKIILSLKDEGVITEEAEEETPSEDKDKDKDEDEGTEPGVKDGDNPKAKDEAEVSGGDPKPADKTKDEDQPKRKDKEDKVAAKAKDEAVDPRVAKKLLELDAKSQELDLKIGGVVTASELEDLRTLANSVMDESLADDAYIRFSDNEKVLIKGRIDVTAIHEGLTDPTDKDEVGKALAPLMDTEISEMDETIAAASLQLTGYPAGSGRSGIVIVNEAKPYLEGIGKLASIVESRLAPLDAVDWEGNPQLYGDDHPVMKFVNEKLLPKFDQIFYHQLMNEAGEEVTQLDIGVRVATIARTVIPAAWRRITALEFCDVGTMEAITENLPVAAWLPAETTSTFVAAIAYINAMYPGESGSIVDSGITYSNVPLYASAKKLQTSVTEEAKATARGTAMNPEADSIAGLALEIRNKIDLELWYMMIARAMAGFVTEVTTFESMTNEGGNVWATAASVAAQAASTSSNIVPFEWYKTVDANGNPTAAQLNKLHQIPANNTLEPLSVQEEGGDNTDLVWDTDYSVDWNTGKILLTATGVTKEAGNGLQAKYCHTANMKYWSIVPDAGVQLAEWMINFRRAVGQAKVLVAERHYNPNVLALNIDTEDLLSHSDMFTAAGLRASDVLSEMNEIVRHAGLGTITTTAIPKNWGIVAVRGAARYAVHTPWYLKGPITTASTGDDIFDAFEFSGNDVPVPGKFGLVGVQQLDFNN